MGGGGPEIDAVLTEEVLDSVEVGREGVDGSAPLLLAGRRRSSGPVVVGKHHGAVGRVAEVVEHVDLAEPHVLEQLPKRVVDVRGANVDAVEREAVDRFEKGHVGVPRAQLHDELIDGQQVHGIHRPRMPGAGRRTGRFGIRQQPATDAVALQVGHDDQPSDFGDLSLHVGAHRAGGATPRSSSWAAGIRRTFPVRALARAPAPGAQGTLAEDHEAEHDGARRSAADRGAELQLGHRRGVVRAARAFGTELGEQFLAVIR